ncbi:condensation domain-containing protein, partial [Lysinibacillus xylanilyticus]|uniref:condensation domain-containing protein n=1 Tax=Lysinibacillus xylanilyticus TaxID=582475 RepID=UPI0037FE86D8
MKGIKESDPIKYWKEAINKAMVSEEIKWSNSGKGSNEKGVYSILLDKYHCDKLKEISKNNNLITYTFLVSVLKICLSKYLHKNDITIGIPCYRSQNQKKIILNKVLPLTSSIDYNESFLSYMMIIKDEILQLYKNQSYLNPKILQDENINNMMELTSINICMKGLHDEKDIDYILNSNKNEMSFLFESLQNNVINIRVIYNKQSLSMFYIEALCNIFLNIFSSIILNYNLKVSEIGLLSEEEKSQILYEFNNTKADYPNDKTIQ